MISPLEIRRIFEGAFLPDRCVCMVNPDNSISLQVSDASTSDVILNIAGLSRSEMTTSRAISRQVLQIRQDVDALRTNAAARQLMVGWRR